MLRPRIAAWVAIALFFGAACDRSSKGTAPGASASAEPQSPSSASAEALASAAPSASAAEPDPEAATAETADGGAQVADVKPKGGPTVKLLSPGKEPRTKLRYELKPKTSDKLDFITTSTLSMDVGGQQMKTPTMPGVRMAATLNVLDIDETGLAKRKLVVDKVSLLDGPGLPADTKGQINTQLKGLEQLRVTDKLDTRGVVRSLHIETGTVTDPQLKQLVGSMEHTFG
jgi:hypothetical protein